MPEGTFSNLDYSFKTLEHRLRELAFLNSGVRIILEDERHAEPQQIELFYEGGVREFVKYIDRSKTSRDARTDLHDRRKERHRRRSRDVVERQLPRKRTSVHKQHPAARRRHRIWPVSGAL